MGKTPKEKAESELEGQSDKKTGKNWQWGIEDEKQKMRGAKKGLGILTWFSCLCEA